VIKGWGSLANYEGKKTSPSRLVCLRECPELYKHKYIDGEKEQTDSQELGSLVHMRVFEREKFDQKYAQIPEKTPDNDLGLESLKDLCRKYDLKVSGTKKELISRIREGHELQEQFEEMLDKMRESGKEVIPPSLMDKVIKISDKITSHKQLSRLLHGVRKEERGYCQDTRTGLVVRFIPDAFNSVAGVNIIFDLKVTKDWSPRRFNRAIFENAWHMLAAAYLRYTSLVEEKTFDRFVHIAIEPKSPFRIRLYEMDEGTLDAGAAELDFYLDDFDKRLVSGDYSPRNGEDKIMQASLESWDWQRIPEVVYE